MALISKMPNTLNQSTPTDR